MSAAQDKLDKIAADKQKQLKDLEKRYAEAKFCNRKKYDEKVSAIHAETKIRENEVEEESVRINQREIDELKGNGPILSWWKTAKQE